MLRGLLTRLRLHRRPAVAVAAVLMVVQTFLAGLAGAQAALILTEGAGDFAVICHGFDGAQSDHATLPDAPKTHHPCCESCAAGAPPALSPAPALALRADHLRACGSPTLRAVSILIAPRAVRAGLSQAPPTSRLNVT
ncbi:MAG TPA: hypothetical protein VIY51_11780 [Xanthobacteraceae bacterium]